MSDVLTILGLESSCDETAAAVVRINKSSPEILSSVVYDQNQLHQQFGGVVPEIAARAHAEKLDICARQALEQANTDLSVIDVVAVTSGPGLIGGVLSGVMCAKGISAARGIPLIGVNHLAGHALTPRLTDQIAYPFLMLLVSGGHCQFLLVQGCDAFTRLGGTIDDAPGEAFDKSARLLGLTQPGGPSIEQDAKAGNPQRFKFPRPLLDRPDCDMSYSGLKTALRRARDEVVSEKAGLTKQDRSDLSASFQEAVADVLEEKTRRAVALVLQTLPDPPVLTVAGGVASNAVIRSKLEAVAAEFNTVFIAPPLALCTDNAAMIAYAGAELYQAGHRDDLTLTARPRWPLDRDSDGMLGSGKKGAKA